MHQARSTFSRLLPEPVAGLVPCTHGPWIVPTGANPAKPQCAMPLRFTRWLCPRSGYHLQQEANDHPALEVFTLPEAVERRLVQVGKGVLLPEEIDGTGAAPVPGYPCKSCIQLS